MANLRMASNSSEDFVCEGAGGGSTGLDHGAVSNKEITSLKIHVLDIFRGLQGSMVRSRV